MSMKGLISSAEPDKILKRSAHRRNDSGELDVFEAARYFSGYNEPACDNNYTSYAHKYSNNGREENQQRWRLGGGRISLDLPIRSSDPIHHFHHFDDYHGHVSEKHEVITMREKLGNVKHKQPSSPGGRIASFLNSLFHQAGSRKNKSKSKSNSTARDEDESPGGWRRRRRSSISHFLMSSSKSSNTASTTTASSSSKSLFSSSSSGFRTPPPYINTPTKNYKEFLSYSAGTNRVEVAPLENHKKNKDLSWLDEKLKFIETLSERQRVWAADNRRSPREEEKFSISEQMNRENIGEDDDGAESDSSSDLFELQNYDLSCGGLPVYETTNVDTIKKSSTAPVSTRPL